MIQVEIDRGPLPPLYNLHLVRGCGLRTGLTYTCTDTSLGMPLIILLDDIGNPLNYRKFFIICLTSYYLTVFLHSFLKGPSLLRQCSGLKRVSVKFMTGP